MPKRLAVSIPKLSLEDDTIERSLEETPVCDVKRVVEPDKRVGTCPNHVANGGKIISICDPLCVGY